MGVRRSEERLAEAAKLYYVDDLNQEQVATALGTTRSNVSRMLQAARLQGIIKFHVNHPLTRQSALEEQVVSTFGIKEAVVLAADADVHVLDRTGELAARWLASQVRDGQAIAVGWGRTLRATAEQLEVDRAFDVTVVQLAGDLQDDPRFSGHELVREVAGRLGGQYSYLHAPALLDSSKTLADLQANQAISAELDKARKADMALVGIGAFGHGYSTFVSDAGHLTEGERAELEREEPAGDILGRFYQSDGREVGPLRGRVLGLDLTELSDVPVVVGVAAGPQKARALWGALRSGLIDVVVCDQSAAAAALHMEREAD